MTFSLSTFQTHGKSTAISIHTKNLPVNSKSSTNVDISIYCKFHQPFTAVVDKDADRRSAAVERVRIGLLGAGAGCCSPVIHHYLTLRRTALLQRPARPRPADSAG